MMKRRVFDGRMVADMVRQGEMSPIKLLAENSATRFLRRVQVMKRQLQGNFQKCNS